MRMAANATTNEPNMAMFENRRKDALSTSDANLILRVLAITNRIIVKTNAIRTTPMRTVNRWAAIIKTSSNPTSESHRISFVRCQRRMAHMKPGMRAVKSVLAGTDHIKPATYVGARLNAALTSNARSSFLRSSIDRAKAPRRATVTTTEARSRIDHTSGNRDTWAEPA